MEDVLDLYAEAYDPRRPVVCFDELPMQLLAEVTQPLAAEPGKPKRQDYEYKRKGHCSLFIAFEPLTGQRQVTVRERRTNADFAQQMQQLVASYPEAEVIRVVLDNLNTHTPAALYQTFPADEARRLTRKLGFHYTPKHGSWLNMAEIEWSVLARQALIGRLADITAVEARVSPWQTERNQRRATVNWCFSTAHARTKLARLYPG
ncbi:MAG: Mobile element protein [uncultured Chloroflexia bacterium]|uniref:Mobile element protein n=1 Tax=uncultured Chloroflexia bacterium TaxID=1672391 RepID=A0A6J4NH84_9CHLR|nr:MAG: Mobile element protein [uncultured Chloroflexia bacterium]